MARLKVYRTPIGFYDAYVAAPSQKAALAAWGSSHDLFARGSAELVADEALTREPLANPGTVIKRSRGTFAEQLAAVPEKAAARHAAAADDGDPDPPDKTRSNAKARPAPKPRPKPSRAPLDAAEAAVDKNRTANAAALAAIDARMAMLEKERRSLAGANERELRKREAAVARAAASYQKKLKRWTETP